MADYSIPFWHLRAILGEEKAIQLCQLYGGRSLYVPVPSSLNPHRQIVRRLGMEAAKKLSKEFPGKRLDPPMAKAMVRSELLTRVARGEISKEKAAGELRMTTRHVRRLVNDRPYDEGQADLFDMDE